MAAEKYEDEPDDETELHGDGDIEEVLCAEQEADETRQDARQNVALEAEDGADRDGQRGGKLKLQPWHEARQLDGSRDGDQGGEQGDFGHVGGGNGKFFHGKRSFFTESRVSRTAVSHL